MPKEGATTMDDEERRPDRFCRHVHTYEDYGYPEAPDGRVKILAVCEDCGKVIGQTGWTSV
jgi:hypothetical protein